MTTSNRKLKLPSQTGEQHHGKSFQHALIPERKHQTCIVCKHDSVNVIKTSATLTLPHQKQRKKKQKRVGADNYIDEDDKEGDDDDDDNEVQSGSKTTFLCFCYEFHSHGQPDGGQCPHCITSYAETGHFGFLSLIPSGQWWFCCCETVLLCYSLVGMAWGNRSLKVSVAHLYQSEIKYEKCTVLHVML